MVEFRETVLYEESVNGSSPKCDDDEKDKAEAPQKNDDGSIDPKEGNEGVKGLNANSEESAALQPLPRQQK